MLDHRCRVLLVEDNPDDIDKLQKLITTAKSPSFSRGFELLCAETLDQGRDYLAQGGIDVVLLDLMLPDSRGMETLRQMQQTAFDVPIIVQSVLEDERVAVKALELGACGYLPKAKLDTSLLVYAIRAALERRYHLAALEQHQQQQELKDLEKLITGEINSTQKSSSVEPLHQRMPDVFEELMQHYGDLMEWALEERIYKVEHQLSMHLNTFAEQLGLLQASPRDLIELHTKTLKQKNQAVNRRKAQAYTTEGRFLLLEVMGNLAAYYRRYFIGLSKINLGKDAKKFSP
ncbi:MAG: response regulator [Coleofasciculus sp. G1-WW12-02]|uniref:response regulator transcription factor n=1 Tax=unclassified Coleofasciculus TaxID=2692782 RepID=UPI0032FFCC70